MSASDDRERLSIQKFNELTKFCSRINELKSSVENKIRWLIFD